MGRARGLTATPDFYLAEAPDLARSLLGQLLVSRIGGVASGVIVETEAYLGPEDLASHCASGGPAADVFYRRGGIAYVYRIHQSHCFNIVAGPEGKPGAVLIRALEPKDGLALMARRRGRSDPANFCRGPGRLAQALGIGRDANGLDLVRGPIRVHLSTERAGRIVAGPRIGISRDAHRPLRFVLAESPFLSRPANGSGRRDRHD